MTDAPVDRGRAANQLRDAVQAAVGLTAGDIDQIMVLIDAGELQLALDTLCTQIFEYDVEITRTQRHALERLGSSLGVPVDYLLGDPWADRPSEGGSV